MQETSITLASMCMCIMSEITIMVTAIAASIWPPRSLLTSNLNSVASTTYVSVPLWPLNGCIWQIFRKKKNKPNIIDLLASPQVKSEFLVIFSGVCWLWSQFLSSLHYYRYSEPQACHRRCNFWFLNQSLAYETQKRWPTDQKQWKNDFFWSFFGEAGHLLTLFYVFIVLI